MQAILILIMQKMPDEDAEEAREGLVEEKGFLSLPSELSVMSEPTLRMMKI